MLLFLLPKLLGLEDGDVPTSGKGDGLVGAPVQETLAALKPPLWGPLASAIGAKNDNTIKTH